MDIKDVLKVFLMLRKSKSCRDYTNIHKIRGKVEEIEGDILFSVYF